MKIAPLFPLRSQPKGFTLIELIVVISIISIMAAILLPALASARQMARATLCGNMARQVGLMTALYATAHDDRLPIAYVREAPGVNRYWTYALFEEGLLKHITQIHCPGVDFDAGLNFHPDASISSQPIWSGWSYPGLGYNLMYIGASVRLPLVGGQYEGQTPQLVYGISARTGEIARPSQTITHADSRLTRSGLVRSYYRLEEIFRADSASSFGVLEPWHQESLNTLWADGHVSRHRAVDSADAYNQAPFLNGLPNGHSRNHFDRK